MSSNTTEHAPDTQPQSTASLSDHSESIKAPVVKEEYTAKSMTIRVSDPLKHSDSTQGTYISYLITTITEVGTFNSTHPRPVRRRFQDFVWLHNALILEFPACIVPPLPEKHRLEYIKGDRFSAQFIERRKVSLQWFLDRIAQHPKLQTSQCTRIFLESNDFRNDKRVTSQYIPPSATVFQSLSDTLVNAFTKIRKPDERFVNMKEVVDKLEDNLGTVERLYNRIGKRQHDLEQDYTSFADSIQGLSALESELTVPLHRFAKTTKAYVSAMKEMTTKEEMFYLNEIHDLLAYCHATKSVLKARDQKQMDFEELSAYLQQAIAERERTLYPRHHVGNRGMVTITDFVTDKINEVRGIDMQRARREKLSRLEAKITELQDEVARTNDISDEFSAQVIRDFSVFENRKTDELKQGLAAYADCHIEFFQKGISIWEEILPVLESISIDDPEQVDR
ncbi:uncharacterized protein BYT42DRAFT_554859 [Radiomyces spectabilis]|uniref:uncharacterized protein n=1 Tax=Radiomyces spectabilis TaxID=64574 RepID=UPI00221E6E10|nr:uncharacterized protein BYT42DRAFT_554859 [Radiomyces spectabilis]KAI8390905.1 hypothetical protein BYT42DRAFT_554859 [Radiomyces spectabilis]